MPTYQYACTACDHGFEVVQAFTDEALTECPECRGRLRKVFGSVGVVFKGSGFYRTDSREKPKTETAEKAKGDGKADGGAKTDGKPKSDVAASNASSTSSTSSTSGSSGASSNGSSGSSGAKAPSTAGSAA